MYSNYISNTGLGYYEKLDSALVEMRQYVSTSVLPLIDICLAKDKVERIVNDAKIFGNYDVCDRILKELQNTIDVGRENILKTRTRSCGDDPNSAS